MTHPDGFTNRTDADAFARVRQAQVGCLVNATDAYLAALKRRLHQWIDVIDTEMAMRVQKANRKAGLR